MSQYLTSIDPHKKEDDRPSFLLHLTDPVDRDWLDPAYKELQQRLWSSRGDHFTPQVLSQKSEMSKLKPMLGSKFISTLVRKRRSSISS